MKTFLFLPLFVVAVALSSCTNFTTNAQVAPGSEYGRGTNNGNSRPYRTDGKVVSATRAADPYYQGNGTSRYDRSPYGGGPARRYPAMPMPFGYGGYGYPGYGYGYPGYGYGRW